MKKNQVLFVVSALTLSLAAATALASTQPSCKNECLLYGTHCPGGGYTLPDRIAKVTAEISKGEACYTPQELKLLEKKLKEDKGTMRELTKPGKK